MKGRHATDQRPALAGLAATTTTLTASALSPRLSALAATLSTTYLEPYNLARTVASLDHISGGRAAWNIVTGSNKDDALHFDLYGIGDNGYEILMTIDHIKAKSKGGINHIDNYQTLCTICNEAKADFEEFEK